jgi:hypothetical protein
MKNDTANDTSNSVCIVCKLILFVILTKLVNRLRTGSRPKFQLTESNDIQEISIPTHYFGFSHLFHCVFSS